MCDPLRLATLVVTDKRSMRGLASAFSRQARFMRLSVLKRLLCDAALAEISSYTNQSGTTLFAHGPFWPCPTSYSTFCPSLSDA